MSSRIEVTPTRFLVALLALAFAVSLLGTAALAQSSIQPKDEIFGGYSWLEPNGWGDLNYKVNSIPKGFDASNTYYFSRAHNFGLLMDGSGHFNGATTPGNPLTSNDKTSVGYALFGLQYKYHTDSLSPFVRGFVGTANISPDCCHDTEWSFAAGGGGGLDLRVNPRFSIRLAQADYIYSHYSHIFASTHPTQWNSVRLAAGLVINVGNYNVPTPTASCSVTPATVMVGEPVTVTAAGSGFNQKHTLKYTWNTNGGKMSANNAATAKIDTTGMKGGSYSATANVTDPKGPKNHNMATCGANFTVNEPPPPQPPQVSCSANPSTVFAPAPSTITAQATSPDNAQITSYSYQTTAGAISGTGSTATLDTTGLRAGSATVTVTATDSRGLTGTCNTTVNIQEEQKPQVTARTPIQFIKRDKQKYVPWRVDNEAKAILDDDATALKNDPNGKLVIVGYADGEPPITTGTGKKKTTMDLAAQRAVNAKAYLVQQQGIDQGRIEVRKGTGKDHSADIFWVPQGADVNTAPLLQGTTPVDESVVTPSKNAYPPPHPAKPEHKGGKKPAETPQP